MPNESSGSLPNTIGTGDLARLIDVTPQFLSVLVRDGHLPRVGHGTYPFEEAVRGYVRFLREGRKATPKTNAATRLQESRADEVALRVAERQRELIPIEDAEAALDQVLATVRSELAGFAARVTRDLPLRRQIEQELNGSLGRMADALDASSRAARSGRDAASSGADPDAGRLGEAEPPVSGDGRPAGSAGTEPDALRHPAREGGGQRPVQARRGRDGSPAGKD